MQRRQRKRLRRAIIDDYDTSESDGSNTVDTISSENSSKCISIAEETRRTTTDIKKKGKHKLVRSRPKEPTPTALPDTIQSEKATECSICWDPCMNSGTHRLVSLKCGHLFGKKCVEQWLKSQSTCPTCKVRVRKTDIRIIFCDRIAVVDNQTIEELKAKLEKEKVRNQQLQAALSQRTSSQSHSPPRRCTSPSPVHTTNSSDLISKYVVLLSCPYQEREEAKALGARFDGQLKKWYVPPGLNVRLFSKWLPQPMSSSDRIGKGMSVEKIYLDCPYRQKDQVKELGGQWDKDRRLWFIPPGIERNFFTKWKIKN